MIMTQVEEGPKTFFRYGYHYYYYFFFFLNSMLWRNILKQLLIKFLGRPLLLNTTNLSNSSNQNKEFWCHQWKIEFAKQVGKSAGMFWGVLQASTPKPLGQQSIRKILLLYAFNFQFEAISCKFKRLRKKIIFALIKTIELGILILKMKTSVSNNFKH